MKPLLIACVVAMAFNATADVRQPAVAGSFYPGDAEVLRAEIESMLKEARAEGGNTEARALVVPHAGYVFSGATAAKAFVRLPDDGVRRVILLGPSHHFSYRGGALPSAPTTGFATPLGTVPLDKAAIAKLRKLDVFAGPAKAHTNEHSLEVELPFLQVVAPEAALVPIAVGGNTDLETCIEMARAVSELIDEGTVVIASSDFTHHGSRYGWSPYEGTDLPETLLAVATETAERAVAMDPRGFLKQIEVSGDTVCGARPIGVLTALLAHAFDGDGQLIEVTTSGHVTGSFDLSVSYVAVAYTGSWRAWSDDPEPESAELSADEGAAMIALARASLESYLTHDTSVAGWFADHPAPAPSLLQRAGAFVTVNNTGKRVRTDGKLRACMGVIEAEQPLLDAVVQAAVWAAQDPRFPPLELSELDDVELEVSVLSPMRPVRSVRFIDVEKHGVLMTKDGRRALFLPQVATEQGWNRDTMLDQLSLKAGLPRTAWQHGAQFQVFTAQVLEEER